MEDVEGFLVGLQLRQLEFVLEKTQALISERKIDAFLRSLPRAAVEDVTQIIVQTLGRTAPESNGNVAVRKVVQRANASPSGIDPKTSMWDRFSGEWFTPEERLVIEGDQIKWRSGRSGTLTDCTSTGFAMRHTDGRTYTATVGPSGQTLEWSDGDRWSRSAQTHTPDATIDGAWCTTLGEEAAVAGGEVRWASGRLGTLDAVSPTRFEMLHTDGNTYTGSLRSGGATIAWSDGDVWSRRVSENGDRPSVRDRAKAWPRPPSVMTGSPASVPGATPAANGKLQATYAVRPAVSNSSPAASPPISQASSINASASLSANASEEALANLGRRYPGACRADLERALRRSGGHAGKAGKLLAKNTNCETAVASPGAQS